MLEGKTALITGGSSGIGKAVAIRFAEAGGRVAGVASSDFSKAVAVVEHIASVGGAAKAYVTDVRDKAAVATLVDAIEKDLGNIDILVTSAGIFVPNPIGVDDGDLFDRMIDINLKGTFYCVNTIAPRMIKRGGGSIVLLSSAADRLGIGTFSGYCASKAGVTMLAKTLALELAPHNININAISPGNTATPMNEGMRNDPAQAGLLAAMKAATPSTRAFSEASDIAEMALFMCSSAGRAMHGASVVMDEGLSTGVLLG